MTHIEKIEELIPFIEDKDALKAHFKKDFFPADETVNDYLSPTFGKLDEIFEGNFPDEEEYKEAVAMLVRFLFQESIRRPQVWKRNTDHHEKMEELLTIVRGKKWYMLRRLLAKAKKNIGPPKD